MVYIFWELFNWKSKLARLDSMYLSYCCTLFVGSKSEIRCKCCFWRLFVRSRRAVAFIVTCYMGGVGGWACYYSSLNHDAMILST